MVSKLSITNFVNKKNIKKIFTPGPSSLSVENLMGIEPCFGRGDKSYDQIEKFVLSKIKKFLGIKK